MRLTQGLSARMDAEVRRHMSRHSPAGQLQDDDVDVHRRRQVEATHETQPNAHLDVRTSD